MVVSVAFVFYALVVFGVGHYRTPTLWENGLIAENMWDGRGFSANFSGRVEPTSWQAPGYPCLLVAAWSVWGRTPAAHLVVSLFQAAALAGALLPMRWLARRWFGPRVVAWVTVVALGLPLYAWYATRLHHTALVMALHPWLVWGWLTWPDRARAGAGLGLGLLTGVAGLFQPVLLAVFGLLSGARCLVAVARRQFRVAGHVLLAGGVTLAVLVPWTVRNYEVHGRLLLVKNSFGKEFWMGNNPHATGTGYVAGGGEEITAAHPPRAFERRGELSEMQMMDALQAEGMDCVRSDPSGFAWRTLRKILWFWTLVPAEYVRSSFGGEALTFRWVHAGYWFLFVALAGVAAVGRRPWPREYASVLGLYGVVYSLVYGLTHVGQARFRGEIEFMLLPAVAVALAWIADRVRGERTAD